MGAHGTQFSLRPVPHYSGAFTTVPTRILVAEDEPMVREVIERMLTRAGYVVESCANGSEAWARLQSQRYDLLVTDNSMPGLTGVELCGQIYGAKMNMAVIVMSGAVIRETPAVQWGRSAKLATVFAKPFTAQELLQCVRTVLAESGGIRSAVGVEFPVAPDAQAYAEPFRHGGLND